MFVVGKKLEAKKCAALSFIFLPPFFAVSRSFRSCPVHGFLAISVRHSRSGETERSTSSQSSESNHFSAGSNGKMRFQSFFMLMTVQPLWFASAISESLKVPMSDFAP